MLLFTRQHIRINAWKIPAFPKKHGNFFNLSKPEMSQKVVFPPFCTYFPWELETNSAAMGDTEIPNLNFKDKLLLTFNSFPFY